MAKKARTSKRHPLASAPVINAAQLGGIETSVLDDGPGRGTRIAWVNTGGGLRYKVVIDRGLDILDAEFHGMSLTWHSLVGITAPSFAYHQGLDWLRSFGGGLVTSCGPCSMGAPCTDGNEELGLHGTHSNTAARVESILNPDLRRGCHEMSITGVVRTAKVFNPNVELRRTVRSPLGEPVIEISDHFVNCGNEPVPHAWLLHINFGYPLLEPEVSTYCYKGKIAPRADSVEWYSRKDFRRAVKPTPLHKGVGEDCTYVEPQADRQGWTTVGVVNEKRRFGVKIDFNTKQFPRMVNWQHWGPGGSYVGALEPVNGGVEGRPVDRKRGWLDGLKPGETRDYFCRITATSDERVLKGLLRLT
ncbi:MAG: DUF4432 family protein [Phycisphaerae bacterium]|nr:DUF4432 family protein [Phycisphaerae bacterium]